MTAAEKTTATPTTYLVLRKVTNTDLPPDPKAHLPMSWATVNEVSATMADTIEVLRNRGLTDEEAEHVASAIRFSCRTGTRLPPHVRELLDRP